jgi:signal transduction histidine kinase
MYSFLITALICGALALAAISYKSKTSLSFAFLCTCFALWSLELFFLATIKDKETLSVVFHCLRIGMFFIPPALVLFSAVITNTKNKWFDGFIITSIFTAFSISLSNNIFFPSILDTNGNGFLPKPDFIHLVFKVNFVLSVIISVVICIQAYKKTIFTEKQRIAWIIMAYCVGAPFGFFALNFSKLAGTLGTIIFLSLLAYAVFRYRLISTRFAISQLLAKGIVALSLVMGYIVFCDFTLQNGILDKHQTTYAGAAYMLICVGLYNKIQGHFYPYANSLLIDNFYNLKQEQSQILYKLSHFLERKEFKNLLDDVFYRLIKVQNYRLYLCDDSPTVFKEFDLNTNRGLKNEVQIFNGYNELTYYEEADQNKKSDFTALKQSAFLPIYVNSEVIGMITLGQPTKKEQFSYQDTQLLTWLSKQLGSRLSMILKYNESIYELEEARRTLSMVSTFNAYNHDVKAPFYNIAAVLRSDNLFSIQEKEKMITEQVEFGLNRVTTMCNILNGNNNQSKQSIDLNELITNIHNMFKVKLGLSKLNLKTIPQIFAKKDMVEILLSNLYKNAIEASKDSAQINIETFYNKINNKIVFKFSDKGKGMPAEIIKKLFKQSMTTKKGGSGVGMSLIKNIIDELDGTIDIKSVIDHGTTFTFNLSPALKSVN